VSTLTDDKPGQPDRLTELKAHLQATTRAVRGNGKAGYDTLLFLNTQYESFPVQIQQEDLLSPAAKTVYNNLWIWAKSKQSNNLSTSLFPEYEWIMRAASISRGSVASSITQLRLLRYITLHKKIRNENNQFIGNDFILNDEPMSIPDNMILDADYVQFVSDSTRHRHKRVQHIAHMMIKSLSKHMDTTDDPYRPQTQIEKIEARQQANQIIQQRLFPEDIAPDAPKPTSYYGIPIQEYEAVANRVHKMNAEEDKTQVHNVNAGNQGQVHKVNAALPNTQVHKVNAAQTASDQAVHNVNAEVNLEVNSSSSSNIYNTTTTVTEFTGDKDSQQGRHQLAPTLVFPEFELPNEKNLVALTIAKLPAEYQQPMLDELAGRLADPAKEPVRNTIYFLQGMVNKFLNGEFTFSSYSTQQVANRNPQTDKKRKPKAEVKINIRNLHSEIEYLSRMIEFNESQGNEEGALSFIEQRGEKQQELDNLVAEYQATG
jgi:hypothetical protein